MYKILYLLLSLLVITPALAATQLNTASKPNQESELIYRTNLGRADDVKLLLKSGLNVNLKDENGTPLLSLAADRQDKEAINVLKALVEAGADLSATDKNGRNALFHAAKLGNVDMVNYLLDQGINYYAQDNDGNVARTIAYNAGHKDIVEILDNFVRDQTQKVDEQYEKNNKIIADQYKEIEKQREEATKQLKEQYAESNKVIEERYKEIQKRQADIAAKEAQLKAQEDELAKAKVHPSHVKLPSGLSPSFNQAPSATDNVQPLVTPPPAAEETPLSEPVKTPEELAKEKDKQAALDQQHVDEVRKLASQLAFHYCAFQYWYYCRSDGLTTELSPDELNLSIESHADQISTITDQINKNYQVKPDFITQVGDSAKTRIFNDLNAIPTKRQRREKGIGRMDDMQSRCNVISREWYINTSDGNSAPAQTPNRGGGMTPQIIAPSQNTTVAPPPVTGNSIPGAGGMQR